MSNKYLFKNIDGTLIISRQSLQFYLRNSKNRASNTEIVSNLSYLGNLDLPAEILDPNNYYYAFVHFVIHKIAMAKIVRDCLEQGVKLGFVTGGKHSAEQFLPLLASLYGLPLDAFAGCIFINNTTINEQNRADKAPLLRSYVDTELNDPDAQIVLLDDELQNKSSCVKNNVFLIHTRALDVSATRQEKCDYLLELIKVLELKVRLEPKDLPVALYPNNDSRTTYIDNTENSDEELDPQSILAKPYKSLFMDGMQYRLTSTPYKGLTETKKKLSERRAPSGP